MARQGAWIDVYPLNGRNLSTVPTRNKASFGKELSDYMNSLNMSFNSLVPSVESIIFGRTNGVIKLGTMQYREVKALTDSLAKKLPFAPELGFNPALSVGFLTATKDSKVVFQRRPEGVHCPRTLIHEPCGYMSSGYIEPRPKDLVSDEVIENPRLYDVQAQLNRRKKEIAGTFNAPVESVSYNHVQDFLGAGWRTVEAYLSSVGKINMTEKGLRVTREEMIKSLEMQGKQKEADKERGVEHLFVPFEQLKNLIFAQGKLSNINPVGYEPANLTDLPMLDESLSGLIWGYEKLTGQKLDLNETVERLNRDGLSIKVYDTSAGREYKFPAKF
ncbi:hypothetical protein HY449_02395 [Candidatus Pacearchaeota archaeon]|nr:hypothetical protein [Candidatus Pacearchaeota archaeon]